MPRDTSDISHEVHVSGELEVTIDRARWSVSITIRDAQGSTLTYIASADKFLTEGDQIWFGTLDEFDEAARG